MATACHHEDAGIPIMPMGGKGCENNHFRNEDTAAFNKLRQDFIDYFEPAGPLEQELVDTIVADLWRQRRVHVVEAGIFEMEYPKERNLTDIPLLGLKALLKNHPGAQTEDAISGVNNNKYDPLAAGREQAANMGLAFMRDCNGSDAFIKLSRYEAAIGRSLYRTLHELERIQAKRLRKTLGR